MQMGELSGKVVAVTGASSGIGQRIAETVGTAGAHVFMCGRTADAMEASRAKIEASGGSATIQTFDITDEAALRGFVEAAAAHGNGLDSAIRAASSTFPALRPSADCPAFMAPPNMRLTRSQQPCAKNCRTTTSELPA